MFLIGRSPVQFLDEAPMSNAGNRNCPREAAQWPTHKTTRLWLYNAASGYSICVFRTGHHYLCSENLLCLNKGLKLKNIKDTT